VIQFNPTDGVDTSDTTAVRADLLAQAEAYVNEHFYPEINYAVNGTPDGIVNVGDWVTCRIGDSMKLRIMLLLVLLLVIGAAKWKMASAATSCCGIPVPTGPHSGPTLDR
jgi:hypothetical protein